MKQFFMSFLLAFIMTGMTSAIICPSGYALLNIFLTGCHKVVTEKKNWNDARAHCNDEGAGLVTVETAVEDHLIELHLRLTKSPLCGCDGTPPYNEGQCFWTSGQRLKPGECSSGDDTGTTDFVWRPWPFQNTPMVYRRFANGQPDCNIDEGVEDSVEYRSAYGYAWNDVAPSKTACFICEITPKPL